jgi:thymidine phosphorylase
MNQARRSETFRRNVEAQHGDPRVCDDPAAILPLTDQAFKVESPRSGFVLKVDTQEVGHAIAAAGGGRVRIEDRINPVVGFKSEVKIGDELRAGDSVVWFSVMTRPAGGSGAPDGRLRNRADAAPEVPALIKEVIDK